MVWMFQFHNGSIKGLALSPLRSRKLLRFNSTMVRLKVAAIDFDTSSNPGFNSTMVRLKVCPKRTTTTLGKGFNSTMVRLKESAKSLTIQFLKVSIPQWFD